MKKLPVAESIIIQVIEHIIHDNLPIAPIGNGYIAPAGSRALEQRSHEGEYEHPEYGIFVFTN